MRVKTSELIGLALDWAVLNALKPNMLPVPTTFRHQWYCGTYNYSTDWYQGGPIIERERITVHATKGSQWMVENETGYWFASTLLIAAMRCYVASKLGDEVEIPEELV